MSNESIYDPRFVRSLFDEMASTYGIVNLVTSFGFTFRWRRQCVQAVCLTPKATVLDLMTGMAENFREISRRLNSDASMMGLDISPEMCHRARQSKWARGAQIIESDALDSPIQDESVDYIFSTFGLKTFNHKQLEQLAIEIHRILRPGGQISFIEISVPPNFVLRMFYMFYLRYIIPILGRLLLGNPDNYRLLGVYTAAFDNCKMTSEIFASRNLECEIRSYFFGCATGIVGRKPMSSDYG